MREPRASRCRNMAGHDLDEVEGRVEGSGTEAYLDERFFDGILGCSSLVDEVGENRPRVDSKPDFGFNQLFFESCLAGFLNTFHPLHIP